LLIVTFWFAIICGGLIRNFPQMYEINKYLAKPKPWYRFDRYEWYRLERYGGTDCSAMTVPIHALRWYRLLRYDGTDSPILSGYVTEDGKFITEEQYDNGEYDSVVSGCTFS